MSGVDISKQKEKLAEYQREEEARKNARAYYKPEKKGEPGNMLRMCPPYDDTADWCFEAMFHYLQDKVTLLCPKSFGSDCPICEHVDRLFATKKTEDVEEAKRIKAKLRCFSQIIDLDDTKNPGKVKLYGFGPFLRNAFLQWFANPDYGDFTHPEKGFDILLKVEGEKLDTKYTVMLRRNPRAIPDWPKVKEQMINLRDHIKEDLLPYEKLKGILEGTDVPPGKKAETKAAPPAASAPPDASEFVAPPSKDASRNATMDEMRKKLEAAKDKR